MPGRRGATVLEDLPEEIIDMILVRLPSRMSAAAVPSAPRGAAPPPRLNSCVNTTAASRCSPSSTGGGGLPVSSSCATPVPAHPVNGSGPSSRAPETIPRIPFALPAMASLIRYDGSRFYICNPVICKQALLPWPRVGQDIDNTVIGFYRHHTTGEYRVLWLSSSERFTKHSLYVLAVGSNEPRHVRFRFRFTLPAVSSPSVEQKILKEVCYSTYSQPPVHHNGSLHWCPYFVGGGDINVFDTETESFRLMRCPTHTGFHKKLFNMNGTLTWVSLTISSTDIDVWVMEDYEAEIWAVKYRIDMLKVEASRQLYLSSSKKKMKAPLDSTMQGYGDIAVLNEHEVLIMFNNNLVLRCDIDGKFLGMVNIGKSQYCMKLTHHLLQESIIPIPSNEMQGEDGEPPLSTGHV